MDKLKARPKYLLKQYGIYITKPGKKIIEAFLKNNTILTLKDVKCYCVDTVDPVTIYRTLLLFVKKKIIRQLPSTNHLSRCALIHPANEVTQNYCVSPVTSVKKSIAFTTCQFQIYNCLQAILAPIQISSSKAFVPLH